MMTDYSYNISASILSNTQSVASTIPKTGLRRLLIQLLIIIYIFVDITVIIAYSTHLCKQATKITSKETLQSHVDIFRSENMLPYIQYEGVTEDGPLPMIPQNWNDV